MYLLSDIFVPDSTLEDDWTLPGSHASDEDNSDEDYGQVVLQEIFMISV